MKVWITKPVSELKDEDIVYSTHFCIYRNGFLIKQPRLEETHYLVPIEANVLTDEELKKFEKECFQAGFNAGIKENNLNHNP